MTDLFTVMKDFQIQRSGSSHLDHQRVSSTYLAGATRPPSTTQKDYMRRDLFPLNYVKAWASLILKEKLYRIEFHPSRIILPNHHVSQAIRAHDDSASQGVPLEGRCMAIHALQAYRRAKEVDELEEEVIQDATNWLSPSFMGVPIAMNSSIQEQEVHVTFLDESNELSSRTISFDIATIVMLFSEGELTHPVTILPVVLYITDLFENVENSRGAGLSIPRWLPTYPSKEFNRLILGRYKIQESIVRAYEAAGHSLEEMTRESLREFAHMLNEKRSQKANVLRQGGTEFVPTDALDANDNESP